MMSPAASSMRSPGTTSDSGISAAPVSARTQRQVMVTRPLSASAAAAPRVSCQNEMPPEMSTMTPMMMAVEGSALPGEAR